MTLTEDEAKTKACHVGKGPGLQGPCMGSLCMAWRIAAHAGETFNTGQESLDTLQREFPGVFKDHGGAGYPGGRRVERLKDVGYCGRAGMP